MASRYWVGDTGNWDAATTTHWSTSSGGAGGASVPTSSDDVFIDALSGSSPTITITATANCLSLNFTGAITPTFAGSSTLNINGSLVFISAMTLSHSGQTNFVSTSTGKLITSAGRSFLGNVNFNGVGGGWTLQDIFTGSPAISSTQTTSLLAGTLNTNGFEVNCVAFSCSGASVRSLILGASSITCSRGWDASVTTNLTFNAGTSAKTLTGSGFIFAGGGLTYHNLTLTGTTLTISGSNTFNILTFTPAKTVKLTAGTTQSYASLVALGTLGNLISIESTSAGSAASISKSSGIQVFNYCSIKDITATGGAIFNAYNSTDRGGNTGINFLGGNPPTATVNGVAVAKVDGVTPAKVNGV